MATVADTRIAAGQPGPLSRNARFGAISLVIGLLLFSIPTMIFVVRQSWTGEEGAHGPIVLVTGLWLLFRRWKEVSRSEEHTSELHSLMRISYAVFCLK